MQSQHQQQYRRREHATWYNETCMPQPAHAQRVQWTPSSRRSISTSMHNAPYPHVESRTRGRSECCGGGRRHHPTTTEDACAVGLGRVMSATRMHVLMYTLGVVRVRRVPRPRTITLPVTRIMKCDPCLALATGRVVRPCLLPRQAPAARVRCRPRTSTATLR